ncbi:hypothetical protein WK25_29045 [Burkholderia latens]|nr:hypothetical protein WK25_29045 [Burkholderia latens]
MRIDNESPIPRRAEAGFCFLVDSWSERDGRHRDSSGAIAALVRRRGGQPDRRRFHVPLPA